jgi:hypothetical protein
MPRGDGTGPPWGSGPGTGRGVGMGWISQGNGWFKNGRRAGRKMYVSEMWNDGCA